MEKYDSRFVPILIMILVMLIIINLEVSCRDPYEFAPEFDSLTSPPPPPLLLHPCNDTVFRFPRPSYVMFEWSYIEGVQSYFLEHSMDSTFPERLTNVYEIYISSHVLEPIGGKWYWHVRGYNKSWTWFTGWSETWHYYIFAPN